MFFIHLLCSAAMSLDGTDPLTVLDIEMPKMAKKCWVFVWEQMDFKVSLV